MPGRSWGQTRRAMTRRRQAIEREVAQGERAWQPATIEIDGTPTVFDVLVLGQEYWAAVGRVPDRVFIALRSRGVPLTDIAVAREVTS